MAKKKKNWREALWWRFTTEDGWRDSGVVVGSAALASLHSIGCFFIGLAFVVAFITATGGWGLPVAAIIGIGVFLGIVSSIPNFTLPFEYVLQMLRMAFTDFGSFFRYDYEEAVAGKADNGFISSGARNCGYVTVDGETCRRVLKNGRLYFLKKDKDGKKGQWYRQTSTKKVLLDRSHAVVLPDAGLIAIGKVTVDGQRCQRVYYNGKIYVQVNNRYYEQVDGQGFSVLKKAGLVVGGGGSSLVFGLLFALISYNAMLQSTHYLGVLAFLFPHSVIVVIAVAFTVCLTLILVSAYVNHFKATPSLWYSLKQFFKQRFGKPVDDQGQLLLSESDGHPFGYRYTATSVGWGILKILPVTVGFIAILAFTFAGQHSVVTALPTLGLHLSNSGLKALAWVLTIINVIGMTPFYLTKIEGLITLLPKIFGHFKAVLLAPNPKCGLKLYQWWTLKIFAVGVLIVAYLLLFGIVIGNTIVNALMGGYHATIDSHIATFVHGLAANDGIDVLFGGAFGCVSFSAVLESVYDQFIGLFKRAENVVKTPAKAKDAVVPVSEPQGDAKAEAKPNREVFGAASYRHNARGSLLDSAYAAFFSTGNFREEAFFGGESAAAAAVNGS